MKNSDEAIEKVLEGLRNCDAPAGMERRILEAVQEYASSSQSGWRRLRSIWLVTQPIVIAARSLTYGLAMAGLFALVFAIPAFHQREHAPTSSKRNSATPTALPAPPSVVAESVQPPAATSGERPMQKMSKVRRAELTRTSDSIALREMHAPSRPEPPMPLTAQERLLLRFVQTRSPEELAAVNPMKWAARDAEERAEFERFFEHQHTGDNE